MSVQQLLVNVIRVPADGTDLPLGDTVEVPHGLRSNGKDVKPTNIQPQQVTGFVVTAVTDTTITFKNMGSGPSHTYFRVERGLQLEVDAYDFPVQNQYWQGIAPNSGAGGGGGGSITAVLTDAPLTVTDPGGPIPVIGLDREASNLVVAGTKLDLSTKLVTPGQWGHVGTTETLSPILTFDAKGRAIAATEQPIQIGGSPAKFYVDGRDLATLNAAKAYADGLAFGIATKAPAHVATTAPLPAYTVSGDKMTLTANAPYAIFPQIDGQTVDINTERVLVKNESNAANNGIYVLTDAGSALTSWVLTRTADADSAAEICGALVTVQTGDTNAGSVWLFADNPSTFTIGVTAVTWTSLLIGGATASSAGTVFLLGGLNGAGSSFALPKLDVDYVTSGTLPANHGGTGHDSYVAGQMLYADTTSTLAKVNIGAANTVLRTDGTTPSWGKVALGTDVSGTLLADKGGTGLSSAGLDPTKFLKSKGDGTWELATPPVTDTSIKYVLWVATDGNNATGDGSIEKPFASIDGAQQYAIDNTPALFPVLAPIEIMVAPGSYNFTTNLTRLNTFVRGAGSRPEENAATKLLQQVVIEPAAGGSKYNTQIGISGCFISQSGPSGYALFIDTSNPCGIAVVNCYITNTSPGDSVFCCDNANAKVWLYGNVFNAQATTANNACVAFTAGDFRASDNYLLHSNATSGSGSILEVLGTAYGLFDRAIIESRLARCVVVSGAYTGAAGTYKLTLSNSAIYSTALAAKGVEVTAPVSTPGAFAALVINNTFGVLGTTVSVTPPSTPSLVVYGNLQCLPGTTPSLTAGVIPMSEVHGTVNLPSLTASLPLKLNASNNVISQAIALGGAEVSGQLPISKGGTGQTAVGAANTFLKSDGTNTSWSSVNLGDADVTGTLTANKGGTGYNDSGVDASKFLKADGLGGWTLAAAATPGQTAIKNVIYVTKAGSDAIGTDGSIAKPFLTIQAAHDYAANPVNFPVLTPIVISVAPGEYDSPNLSRLNTYLQGAATKPEENAATKLNGVLVLTPAGSGDKYNTQIGIAGFRIDGLGFGAAIYGQNTAPGNPYTLAVVNCYLTNSSSTEPVVSLDNDNAKFLFYNNVINAQAAGSYGINGFAVAGGEIYASDNRFIQPNVTGGVGSALSVSGAAYGTFDRATIDSKLAKCVLVSGTTPAAVATGSYKFTLLNSVVTSTAGSAAGVTVSATATGGRRAALITDTTFKVGGATIAAGTSPVTYGNIVCLPTTVPSFTGSALTEANEAHGSITIPSLANASKPVKADSTRMLVTGDIDLATEVTGQLPVTNGGTGLGSVVQYGILYGDSATSLAVLAPDLVAGKVLTTQGSGAAPQWTTIAAGTVKSITLDTNTTNATGLTVNGLNSDTITDIGTFALGGKLKIGFGGTNSTAAPVTGGVAYGNAGAYAFSGAGTVGDILVSGGTSAPTWTTILPIANGGTNNNATPTANGVAYGDGTKIVYTGASTPGSVLRADDITGVPYWGVNTAVPTGAVIPAADLSGNYPSPTVSRINGVAVTPAGGLVTIGKVLVADSDSSAVWGQLDLGSSGVAGPGITGQLPRTSQQAQNLGGDLSGTTTSGTVIAVRGNPYTTAAPTVGQVPTWDGAQFIYTTPAGGGGGGGAGGGATYYFDSSQGGQNPIGGLDTNTRKMVVTEPASSGTITSGTLPVGSYATAAAFVTNTSVPSLSKVPAGLWDFNIWAEATGAAANEVFVRPVLYKYNGTTPTLLVTQGAPIYLLSPGVPTLLEMQLLIPAGTTIAETDRLYVVFEAQATTAGRTLTLSFGDSTPSHVHTTLPLVSGSGFIKVNNDVLEPIAQQVSLSSDVTGTLPVANGGTGISAPVDGSMFYYSTGSGTFAEVPLGNSGDFLTVSGGVPLWVPVAFGNVSSVTSANAYITVTNNITTPLIEAQVGQIADTLAAGNDNRFNPIPSMLPADSGKVPYANGAGGYSVTSTGVGADNKVLHGGANPTWSKVDLDLDTIGNLNLDRGGTGRSSLAEGAMLYGPVSPSTTMSALSIGSAGSVLISTGSAPQWSGQLFIVNNNVTVGNNARFVTASPAGISVTGASYKFPSTSSFLQITSIAGGIVNNKLTSTPTINNTGGGLVDGTHLTIYNSTGQTIIFQDEQALSGSRIQLGGVTERALGPAQAITFIYSTQGTDPYWIETAVGGSGTVQSVTGSGLLTATTGSNPIVSINGLSSGTQYGVPYFTSSGAMGSSAALTANRLVVGTTASGPVPLTAGLGASNQVLHGNAGGQPTWGAVDLSSDVTGALDVSNGGTGRLSLTADAVLVGNLTSQVHMVTGTSGQLFIAQGGTPAFQTLSKDATLVANGQLTVTGLRGKAISTTVPTSGQVLTYDGTQWAPSSPTTGTVTSVAETSGKLIKVDNTDPANPTVGISGFTLTTPTIGGIPFFKTTSTVESTGALTAFRLVVGGGSSGPSVISSAGTSGQPLLSGGNFANPAFGALDLSDTANTTAAALPVSRGGTGNTAAATAKGVVYASSATAYGYTAAGSQYQVLQANVSGVPVFGAVALDQAAAVTGTLPIANGGTGASSLSAGNANKVFASPDGTSGAPSFRSLVVADLPNAIPASKISAIPYDIAGSAAGIPSADTNIFYFRLVRACTLGGAADHRAGCLTPPTGSSVIFSVKVDGSEVGTFEVGTGGLVTFSGFTTGLSLTAGQLITVRTPVAGTNGIIDPYFTLAATLS